MMRHIENTIQSVLDQNEKALIAYVMAGDPSLAESEQIILEIARSGADIIEIGVPFSDPIADGPTIQKAADRALAHHTSLKQILQLVERLRKKIQTPLILMSYCNPILAYGEAAFFKEAEHVGVNGLIVPDLPPEEAGGFLPLSKQHDIDMIFLLAPTSTPERIKKILKLGRGFVYYVPVKGVTGAKLSGQDDIRERIIALKKESKRPVAVGFGIKSPEDARNMGRDADAVIVGSALVNIVASASEDAAYLSKLGAFVSDLKSALKGDL